MAYRFPRKGEFLERRNNAGIRRSPGKECVQTCAPHLYSEGMSEQSAIGFSLMEGEMSDQIMKEAGDEKRPGRQLRQGGL